MRGHGPGQEVLQTGKKDVLINDIEPVGQYALKIVFSDGHDSFDVRVRVVIRQFEIFEFEVEQVGYGGVELHLRQRARFAGQLQFGLLEVVAVNMRVAQRVDEFARLQTAHLGNHHGQKRVAGDVERHAEEDVRAALVKLAVS